MPERVKSASTEPKKPDFETFLRRVPQSSTALHQAALLGYLDYAKKILEKKSNQEIRKLLLAKDKNGNLPIDRAAPRGHDTVLAFLLEKHEQSGTAYPELIPNEQQYSPLLSAIRWYFNVLDGSYDQGQVYVGKFNTQPQDPKKESQLQHVQKAYHNVIKQLIKAFPQHLKKGADNKGCNALYYLIWIHHNAVQKGNEKKTDLMLADYKTIAKEAESLYKHLLNQGMSLDEKHPDGKNLTARALAENLNSTLPQPLEVPETKEEHLRDGSDLENISPSNIALTEKDGFFAQKKAETKVEPAFSDSNELTQYIKKCLGPKILKTLGVHENTEVEVTQVKLMQTLSKYSGITDKKKQKEILDFIAGYIEVVNKGIIIKPELDKDLEHFISKGTLASKPT